MTMLTGCGGSYAVGNKLQIAAVPERYLAGCAEPQLVSGATKVNEGRLAVAYGKCSRLQRDTATWTRDYLASLAK